MKNVKSTKRLLFISHTNNLKGGGELSLLELLKAAKRKGFDIHVIVPGEGEFVNRLRDLGVKCTPIDYYYWGRPNSLEENKANLTAINKIAQIAAREHSDCIVTNTLMIPWGAIAASIVSVPHVWVAREFLVNHHSHLHEQYDFVSSFSNLVIANSRNNADYMRKIPGLENTKQFYSYVDIQNIKLNSDLKTAKVVCIGRIHPDKNQSEIIEAIAYLKTNKKPFPKVVLIGDYQKDDAYYTKLTNLIKQNQLYKEVTFTNFKSNPYEFVGQEDILIQPSKSESLGRTITEAMKLGLICVGANIPGTREAFELGGGMLYEPGDVSKLGEIISAIHKDPEYYKKQAKVYQAKALKNLSEETCHSPFFREISEVYNLPNPRKEIGFIGPTFSGVERLLEIYENRANHYEQKSTKYKKDLENIVNSRSWKIILSLRKILRR